MDDNFANPDSNPWEYQHSNAFSTREILIQAKDLISDPKHWCQGSLFADANGNRTASFNDAIQCCAYGAIHIIEFCYSDLVPHDVYVESLESLESAATKLYSRRVTSVNDTLAHADVMNIYNEAIQNA